MPYTPSAFYSSTQLDNFSAECGFGVNETTIAQSSVNPNLLVAGANTYYDDNGNCQDSHAGVYYSSDGGQHWQFEVMPGLLYPASGDPGVTYDPVRQVFIYSFIEFSRVDNTLGRVGVEVSSDGVNWSRNTTLDSNSSTYETDKPSITVDQNPGSPHYGRVAVAWTEFHGNDAIYYEAYTDDGGVSWTGGDASVNQTSHECGNGTSESFNANGELMVAWADCTGGTNSIYEELSTDGGRTWSTGVDHQITTTNPIEGAEDDSSADCFLNNGGSAFRCNSFPTLAGDPNASDAGGTAFVVGWADVRSTTVSSQTANISQIMALSTVNDGSTWGDLDFMNFDDFGDKFFPAASFAPDGRLTLSYSSRESDASSGNPNGRLFNEHQTEASSLTNLRADSYVSYTNDGTLGDPGSLTFIGDYSGNSSFDANYDTFPVWTDLRNGFPSARTQDLCYVDCMTFLQPDVPLFVSRTTGSSFQDLYRFSMDPLTGSGEDFWNLAATREGTDGTSVDDDTYLAPNRYYNSALASSAFGPPTNDYTVVNGNVGHAPNTVYFPQVHSFSTVGGSYSIEWDAGHVVLGTSFADGMASANVGRIYDTFLSTGTTYFLGLRPNAGNTSNYSLMLHSASDGSAQGRPNAVASSGNVAPGNPAFIQYGTGVDPSQFDGVVVINNNSGSGSYTLYEDSAAPTGTISIDGGAAYTTSTTATLQLTASNPTVGDPVADMQFSTDGGSTWSTFQPFGPTATVTLPSGDGTKTVEVQFRNGAGAVSAPAVASIVLDTTAPQIAKAPAPSFVGGSTISSGSVPIKLSWKGTDTGGSGVDHYALQEKVDSAAYQNVTLTKPKAKTATLDLPTGHSYRFQVMAVDKAGNSSAFVQGKTFTLTLFEENASEVTYSSGWKRQALSGTSGGHVEYATKPGKTADFAFTGSQVALVSVEGANRGSATAAIDGGSTTTINTNSSSTVLEVVVYKGSAATGSHTLDLTVLGSAGHPRFDVDAFLVIS